MQGSFWNALESKDNSTITQLLRSELDALQFIQHVIQEHREFNIRLAEAEGLLQNNFTHLYTRSNWCV